MNEKGYVIEPGAYRVRDMPERLRPREEFARLGVGNVSDEVLLAILLRAGVKGTNVVDLARHLLCEYGSLTALAGADVDELAAQVGMGPVKAQVVISALELAKRLNEEAMPERVQIRTPADAARVLRDEVRTLEVEVFWVLHLDTRNRLKRPPVDVSRGVLDASLVHAREVFRSAIRSSTAAVVIAHNHPSGDATPSADDIKITKQLVDAGRIIGIKVLDHVVLGRGREKGKDSDFLSMREEGIVVFE